jgi:hypothetical protein
MLTRHSINTSSLRNNNTCTQHHINYPPELEDGLCPDEFNDDNGAEEPYQYGATDNDAMVGYALLYDGDDQGAKMRRY